MRGEGERQTQIRGNLRAIEAGPEDPDRHLQPGAGNRLHRLSRLGGAEISHQFDDILREVFSAAEQGAAHRPGGDLIRSGRAPQTQLDPPGVQRGECPELFRDQEWGVVRQHDPAGADPDGVRASRDMGQRHRGRRARNSGQVVMLGHPVALVAKRLDMPREVERITQRLTGIAAFDDWRKIENGERDHGMTIAPNAPASAHAGPGRFGWSDHLIAQWLFAAPEAP